MSELVAVPAATGFESFAELSGAHALRLERKRGAAGPKTRAADPETAARFVERARLAGRLLSDPAERERAQDIIDFWLPEVTAEVGTGRPLAQLAPFEGPGERGPGPNRASGAPGAGASCDGSPQTAPAPDPAGDPAPRGRERIRLSAAARQWRDSGRPEGYLLYGQALEDAAPFTDDPDIRALVSASRRAMRRRRMAWTVFLSVLVLGLIGGIVFLLDQNAKLADALGAVREQKAAADAEAERLAEAVRLIRREVDAKRIAPSSLPPALERQVEDDGWAGGATPAGDVAGPGDASARTTGSELAGKVGLLDAPEAAERTTTAQALVSALRDRGLPDAAQKTVTAALARMAGDAVLPGLTETGRYNLLFVLSEIPWSSWARPDWLDLRATMRRALADLDGRLADGSVKAGPDSRRFLAALRSRLGPDPTQGRIVYLQFAGMTRELAVAVSRDLKALGWAVQGEERTAKAARQNEVRYGDPKDKGAADILAADLRAAGQGRVAGAVRNPDIKAGVLEVWLSR